MTMAQSTRQSINFKIQQNIANAIDCKFPFGQADKIALAIIDSQKNGLKMQAKTLMLLT